MDITFIQCLYIPDEYHLHKAIKSICSLETFVTDLNQIYIYLEGHFENMEYFQRYKDAISTLSLKDRIIYLKNAPNFGRSVVINNCIQKNDPQTKYILYADSDIIFKEEYMFQRLLNVYKYHSKFCKKIGLVALNQLENCRHEIGKFENFQLIGPTKEKLIYAVDGSGISGNCFFMETEILKKFPRPDVGIYGLDDVIYHDVLNQNKYLVAVAAKIKITHPLDPENDYSKWKKSIHRTQYETYFGQYEQEKIESNFTLI